MPGLPSQLLFAVLTAAGREPLPGLPSDLLLAVLTAAGEPSPGLLSVLLAPAVGPILEPRHALADEKPQLR